MYGNNNSYMVVGEIPQFFQFPKRDISTARCKCTIYIITYKGIKVVIRTKLSTWQFYFPCGLFFSIFFFFTWSWIQLFFKGNSSYNKKRLYYDVRSWIVLQRAEFRCSESLFSMLLFKNCISFKFTINTLEQKGLHMSACWYEFICFNWIISLEWESKENTFCTLR